MAVTDRALSAAWNVGIEDITPMANNTTFRVIHAAWNVGVFTLLADRAIHAAWNVGVIAILAARAIHAGWSVDMNTLPSDPPEWILYGLDMHTVENILRGK